MKLRPYQAKLVKEVIEAFDGGAKSVLGVLPTGAGKTPVVGALAHKWHAEGKRVLMLVDRRKLVEQLEKHLKKYAIPYGVIMAGHMPDPSKDLQVASIQSFRNREIVDFRPDYVVVDEADGAIADCYQATIRQFACAKVYGTTATPIRRDGRGLGEVFDRLVVGSHARELIKQRWLAPYKLALGKRKLDLSRVKKKAGDFCSSQLKNAMNLKVLHAEAIETFRKHGKGLSTVVFCVDRDHAEKAAQAFRSAGFSAEAIDGRMKDKKRAEIMARVRSGETQVVTSCDLLTIGVDVDRWKCLVCLRPTASLRLWRQMVGRVLRRYFVSGKLVPAIILDHAGNTGRHGLPDSPISWSLAADVHHEVEEPAVVDEDGFVRAISPEDVPDEASAHEAVEGRKPKRRRKLSRKSKNSNHRCDFVYRGPLQRVRRNALVRLIDAAIFRLSEGGHKPGIVALSREVAVYVGTLRSVINEMGWSNRLRNFKVVVGDLEFRTLVDAAREFGLRVEVVRSRLERGWTLEQALGIAEPPTRKVHPRCRKVKFRGKVYATISEASTALGIDATSLRPYIRRNGVIDPDVLTKCGSGMSQIQKGPDGRTYASISAMCKSYGVAYNNYRARIRLGWTVPEALGIVKHETVVASAIRVKVAGRVFPSQAAAARELGIPLPTVRNRLNSGWSIERAFSGGKGCGVGATAGIKVKKG